MRNSQSTWSAASLERKASNLLCFNPIFLSAFQPKHTPPGSSYSHVIISIPFKTCSFATVTNLNILFA